ncbi:hypothetical protein BBJ28_00017884 [Nothophytophthora sp. Chile5]|nr:hypothetical protein BBJ28_00017884 [Nothophytophthora sp. Chile5]
MANSVASTPRSDQISRRSSSASLALNGECPADAKELSKQRYDSPFDASLVAARKRSQQERLWEIFTAYALQISSEDPTRIRIANVVKLLQDCGIIGGDNTDEAKMIEKEVAIVCEAFLKNHPTDRDSGKKLDFTAFLALLLHFAKMASKGQTDPLPCLRQTWHLIEVLLPVLALSKLEKVDPKMAQMSSPHLSYAEGVAFGRKYGIIAHGVLTTTEFASIYIDSLAKAPATEYDRVLTYSCFCEMLVRLSRKACLDESLPADRNLKYDGGCSQNVTKLFLIHFEKFWKKDRYECVSSSRSSGNRALLLSGAHWATRSLFLAVQELLRRSPQPRRVDHAIVSSTAAHASSPELE